MKMSDSRHIALLQALALMFVLIFVSANAHAHEPGSPGGNAAHGTSFNQNSLDLDCAFLAGGGPRLHCHLRSTEATAPGPGLTLDDNQSILVTATEILPARSLGRVSALAETRIPITGPPAYILFGNFRS